MLAEVYELVDNTRGIRAQREVYNVIKMIYQLIPVGLALKCILY